MGRTALPRIVREFAGEIAHHDWSDAPFRCDRAGHMRSVDRKLVRSQLDETETAAVKLNVAWVVAQVLGLNGLLRDEDDVYEFMEQCGVETRTPTTGRARSGHIIYGLRRYQNGEFMPPYGMSVPGDDDDEMWNESLWTDLDFADDTVVEWPMAAALVAAWMKKRGVTKKVTPGQVRGNLKHRDPWSDEEHGDFTSLGELRRWFDRYWRDNHEPRKDEPPF